MSKTYTTVRSQILEAVWTPIRHRWRRLDIGA